MQWAFKPGGEDDIYDKGVASHSEDGDGAAEKDSDGEYWGTVLFNELELGTKFSESHYEPIEERVPARLEKQKQEQVGWGPD